MASEVRKLRKFDQSWKENVRTSARKAWETRKRPNHDYAGIEKDLSSGVSKKEIYTKYHISRHQLAYFKAKGFVKGGMPEDGSSTGLPNQHRKVVEFDSPIPLQI